MKGIVAQQAQIRADAATLERLQSQASTADGQMAALMAANQLAALQQEQFSNPCAVGPGTAGPGCARADTRKR